MDAEVAYRLVGNLGLLATFVPDVAFLILYSRTQWQGSDVGKNLFYFSLATTVILGLALVGLVYRGHQWFEMVRAVLFVVAVPGVFWWRLIILIKYQREGRRQDVINGSTKE